MCGESGEMGQAAQGPKEIHWWHQAWGSPVCNVGDSLIQL